MTPDDMKHFVGIAHIIRDSESHEIFEKFLELYLDHLPENKRRPHYESFMSFVLCFDNDPDITPKRVNDKKSYTPDNIITAYLASCTFSSIKKDVAGKPLGKGFKHIPAIYAWLCYHFPTEAKKAFHDFLKAKYPDKIPFNPKGRAIWKHVYDGKEPIFSKVPDFRSVEPIKKLTSPDEVRKRIQEFKNSSEFLKDYVDNYSDDSDQEPKPEQSTRPIKRDWLDPYNQIDIPFFGREDEIRRLHDFANDRAAFKIWALIAPSGAGKTRLTYEWTQTKKIKNHWNVLYLSKSANGNLAFRRPDQTYMPVEGVSKKGKNWQAWSPSQNTILIIDYVTGFEEVIDGLVHRCFRVNPRLENKVRLLVLDHLFPDTLDKLDRDTRWESLQEDAKHNIFFDGKPLSLTKTKDQPEIMTAIVKAVAFKEREDVKTIDLSEALIEGALDYLRNTHGTWHPLFAALVGDALQNGRSFDTLDRRKLIESYLSGKKRLPWKDKTLGSNGLRASAFICVATLLSGIHAQDLIEANYNDDPSASEDFAPVLNICEHITSERIDDNIPAFKPDIIGESFFLLFLERLATLPNLKTIFYQMLGLGDEGDQSKRALSFLAVIERLTRNLLNDDQELSQTKRHWKNLMSFLQPVNFPIGTALRWGVSASLVKLEAQISESNNSPLNLSFLDVLAAINKNDLFVKVPDSVLHTAGPVAIRYFHRAEAELSVRGHGEILTLLTRYDLANPPLPALLEIAFIGSVSLYELLKDNGYDIDVKSLDGDTALTNAVVRNHEELALVLIEDGINLDAVNFLGVSALMMTCILGLDRVAHAILQGESDVNLQSRQGWTALMWACCSGNEKVAMEIIKRAPNFNLQNKDGWTALILACRYHRQIAAMVLVEQGADINIRTNDNWTALMHACQQDRPNLVMLLIENGAELNVQNDEGVCALSFAIGNSQDRVIHALIDNGADLNLQDIDGVSPLMQACICRREQIAGYIIEAGANISKVSTRGYSALMIACYEGLEQVVFLLVEKAIKSSYSPFTDFAAFSTAHGDKNLPIDYSAIGRRLNVNSVIQERGKSYTALDFAAMGQNTKIVRVLLTLGAKSADDLSC